MMAKNSKITDVKKIFQQIFKGSRVEQKYSLANKSKLKIAIFNPAPAGSAEDSTDTSCMNVKFIKNIAVEIKSFKQPQEIINFDPDFAFSHNPCYKIGAIPTYSGFNGPSKWINDGNNIPPKKYTTPDGCLVLSEYTAKAVKEIYHLYGKAANILIPFFATRSKTEFKNNLNVEKLKLVYFGNNWESANGREVRFKILFNYLANVAKINFLELYGNPSGWFWIEDKSYVKGRVSFFEENAIMNVYRAGGVGLALSAHEFYKEGLSNNRVFEIVASGAVCIADDVPFYKQMFGDNLLYITTRNEEEMAKQIIAHFNWIESNSKEALEKAKRAHQIFCENLAIESMIEKLINFHYQTQNKKFNDILKIRNLFRYKMYR